MIVFQYKINELYRKYESYGVSLFRFFKMQAALYLSYFCDLRSQNSIARVPCSRQRGCWR